MPLSQWLHAARSRNKDAAGSMSSFESQSASDAGPVFSAVAATLAATLHGIAGNGGVAQASHHTAPHLHHTMYQCLEILRGIRTKMSTRGKDVFVTLIFSDPGTNQDSELVPIFS